mmetsp:Transcript_56371/g.167740  ORF Transcript_56371/g.167740 Transcript_56371/m.167740 type:complete len:196 (-) Transcript_56371:26-613(-)
MATLSRLETTPSSQRDLTTAVQASVLAVVAAAPARGERQAGGPFPEPSPSKQGPATDEFEVETASTLDALSSSSSAPSEASSSPRSDIAAWVEVGSRFANAFDGLFDDDDDSEVEAGNASADAFRGLFTEDGPEPEPEPKCNCSEEPAELVDVDAWRGIGSRLSRALSRCADEEDGVEAWHHVGRRFARAFGESM